VLLDLDLDTARLGLLQNRSLDTLSFGEGYKGSGSLANGKHIGRTCGKRVTDGVLNVDNVVTSGVLLELGDDTDSSQIASAGDGHHVSQGEGHVINNLVVGQVKLDRVRDFDGGVGETKSATVVCDNVGHSVLSDQASVDTAQLECSLLRGDSVDGESSLGVVEKTEGLVGGLDGDDVHETGRVGGVSSNLVVDLDVSLLDDNVSLTSGQSVLQSVSEENRQREALSQLVGSVGGTRSKNSRQFVQHPVAGCIETLQMLLGSAGHD